MNKWQIICPVVAMLLTMIVLGNIHMRAEQRGMVLAVTKQIEVHTPRIEELLVAMRGSNAAVVEDAAFQELKALPSTSLISRSMVRVAKARDGRLECTIDLSPSGIPSRTVSSSR